MSGPQNVDQEIIENLDLLMDMDLFEEEGLVDLVEQMDEIPQGDPSDSGDAK